MCTWVSACSVGDGKLLYFPKHLRDRIKEGTLWDYADTNLINDPDSHSQICAYYGVSVDQVHKYEFRPMDRQFIVDSVCGSLPMDRNQIETKMRRVDCRRLAPPELIFKKIVHPFKLPFRKPTKQDLSLLQKWASVGASVGNSVRDSVRASVRASVGASVGDSVKASVGASVWDSVRASVWDSVRGSVRDSVRASVGASVWGSVWDSVEAYIGSFFKLPRKAWLYTETIPGKGYPFQAAVDLWERGLVPSFDGTLWRLHSGPMAEIVWTKKAMR